MSIRRSKLVKNCSAAVRGLLLAVALFVLSVTAAAEETAQPDSLHVSGVNGGLISFEGDEAFTSMPVVTKRRLKSNGAGLPAEYRTEFVTDVQSQGSLNLCWAYAPLSAGQTGLMKRGDLSGKAVFSPGHLGYSAYHGGSETWSISGSSSWYNLGGNALLAGSTLLRWYGAAAAASYPTSASTSVPEAGLTSSMCHLLGFERLAESGSLNSETGRAAAVTAIKQAVMDYGAVSVDLLFTRSSSKLPGQTYDLETNSSYWGSSYTPNHQVVIVGWDDGKVTKADEPGAFLVENSYGTSFGDEGFFWLSYRDRTFTKPYVWHFENTADGEHIDRSLYSYDGIGYYVYMEKAGTTVDAANLFVAARDEVLSGAGFYVPVGGGYSAQLRVGVDADNPMSGTVAAEVSGTVKNFGFYTVRFPETVSVKKGTRFALIVRMKNWDGSGYAYFEGSSRTLGSGSASLVRQTVCEAGQTFVRVGDGAFTDILEYTFINDTNGKVAGRQYGNACIKVYGNPADGVGDAMNSRSAEVMPLPEDSGDDVDVIPDVDDPSGDPEDPDPQTDPDPKTDPTTDPKTDENPETDPKAAQNPSGTSDSKTPTATTPSADSGKTAETKKAAYVTVYGGVDYAAVYDFNYYMKKYPSLKAKYGANPKGALRYFVKYGMKKMHRASASFNVKSYVNEYASLRRKYGTTWKKYYLHYINVGRKKGWHGTGCSKMKNALTVYKGKNYKKIYNFRYYISRYPAIKKKYQYDDYGALKYFVKYGRKKGQKAKK